MPSVSPSSSRRRSLGLGLCTALGIALGHACSCVAAGTRIATPRGWIDVATLVVGDEIFAVDPVHGTLVPTPVTAIRRARRECLALRAGPHRLVCTPDHPIFTPETARFEPAARFAERRHETVQLAGPERWAPHPVDAIERYAGVHEVFDLSVASPHHDFVAEGLLVHNKSGPLVPQVAFMCTPNDVQADQCPDRFHCCSDDPATAMGEYPDYAFDEQAGIDEPLFAGDNNVLSVSGFCSATYYPDPDEPLIPESCPRPCNPQWSMEAVETVCGERMVCCQTRELTEADCVFDGALGHWRPMDGRDAEAAARRGEPRWGEGGTHQDPEFLGCEAIAGGRDDEAFFACTRRLSVANQRGFCQPLYYDYASPDDPACPATALESACERLDRERGQ